MMKVIILVLLVSLLIEAAICVEGDDQNWSTTQHEEDLDVNLGLGKEKVTRLHFYFHDIERGNKPSAVTIAEANSTKNSPYAFGELFMADDALTVGPELTSKIVGRAQGLYGSADQQDIGLVMALTLHFTEGKYNGSDLSILGRNGSLHSPREFPIVGGTGLFSLWAPDMQYVVLHATIDSSYNQAYMKFYIRHSDGSPISSKVERQRVIQCVQASIERRVTDTLDVAISLAKVADVDRVLAMKVWKEFILKTIKATNIPLSKSYLCRYFGYLVSFKKYIVSVDDDCVPARDDKGQIVDVVAQHIWNLRTPATSFFFNTLYDPYCAGPALFPGLRLVGEGKLRWETVEDVFSECVLRLCRPSRAGGKEWIAIRVERRRMTARLSRSAVTAEDCVIEIAKMVKEQLGPSDGVFARTADAM
ncbi:hypothetical protein IFM89_027153 [Coptis chinensis]|uniref:Dirigent protein n=1 Tax=Coptis chinensis TaxID=261450 RepID=A0A835IEZ0_9MAGN|nr:hypothetical protein IFM89_027153 [Coptis chinensis]